MGPSSVRLTENNGSTNQPASQPTIQVPNRPTNQQTSDQANEQNKLEKNLVPFLKKIKTKPEGVANVDDLCRLQLLCMNPMQDVPSGLAGLMLLALRRRALQGELIFSTNPANASA